jgi:hypothetical protein
MAEVFINYRTGDGDEAAELIASQLSERFGKEHVFKASHSLEPGGTYTQGLLDAATKCDVLLAIMGPDWDTAPQLFDETDWVRREILTAHSFHASVVPVLKGRKTERLVRNVLPPELRWIADVHSLRLDTNRSTDDLVRIGDVLIELVPALKAADRQADSPKTPGATSNSASNVTGNVTQGRDISGGVGNVNVNDAQGATSIGDGNTQINYLNYARLKELQPLPEPIDHLRWLDDRFVPPPGFDAALTAIKPVGTVVLDGPPGTGRTAAAKMLAFRSWPGSGKPHELHPQEPGEGAWLHIDPGLVGRGDAMWLDLSNASSELWIKIQNELPALHTRVQALEARLVVIQPYALGLRSDFLQYLRRIGSPGQTEVFSHLLQIEGLAIGNCVPQAKFLEKQRSMADIRQFVDDILSAKDQSEETGNLEEWIHAAEQPTSPREASISGSLAGLSLAERVLLFCVAMLHGAHADVIDGAAARLLARMPGHYGVTLEEPPLGDRLRKVGASIDIRRCVRFTHSGYDTTIRLFFWRHFPELHQTLTSWVGETVGSSELSDEDRAELASGFASQCLDDDRYKFRWVAMVEGLTAESPRPSRELAAAAILRVGLGDRTNSRQFRRQIYDWSTGRTSEGLATVLVIACQQMSETHPAEALVRLHHLARHHDQRLDIWDALLDVAYSSRQMLRLLLARLTDRPAEIAHKVDPHIFLYVADPAHFTLSLVAEDESARQLAAGWALAFARLAGSGWGPRANDWFTHAAEDDANRHALLNVLVDGARQTPGMLSQLYALAYHSPFRDVIAEFVLERISAVQGVELP